MTARSASIATMDYAFILDPLPHLKAYKDSSIAMMRALAARGHRIYALEQSDIFWDGRQTRARGAPRPLSGGFRGGRDAQGPAVRHGVRVLDVSARSRRA